MENNLPLLSGSLYDLLKDLLNKHSCKIAEDLIHAHSLIKGLDRYKWLSEVDDVKYVHEVIKRKLDSLVNSSYRMLSCRFNDFSISYLPEGKTPKYAKDGVWSRENRQFGKPARVIQKLLVKKYTCKEYEDFSNLLKAEILNTGEFSIVHGEDIRKYYSENSYYRDTGTLSNSCMRYDECQKYLDVYIDNCTMLVYCRNNKLMGRALVWSIGSNTYMDRIYTYEDYLENMFIDYAKNQGWYIRETNSVLIDGNVQRWLTPIDNYEDSRYIDLEVKLDKEYKFFPYLDTFRYYNADKNILFTNSDKGNIRLSMTNGIIPGPVKYVTYRCNSCGFEETICEDAETFHSLVWSDYDNCHFCNHCSVFCNGINDYVGKFHNIVTVYCTEEDYKDFPLEECMNNPFLYTKINNKWYYTASPLIEEKIDGGYKFISEN